MRRLLCALLTGPVALSMLSVFVVPVRGDEDPSLIARVTEPGKLPADARLGKPRDLYDKYHPWVPPTNLKAWEAEAQKIRERVLVSQGLWPLPPKTPLNAVIHGKIDRDGYTVEKVYFQSHPGHYVTGNLYRPKESNSKHAAVLCPHGHWTNGRFYDAGEGVAGERGAAEQIKSGAEKFESGARYPLQARCVTLARMGCTVFFYDMVGYADSKGIDHRSGLTDAEAELRLQNHMGLQTWNSIRALDFVCSLPEVDDKRIGVTGASGGGTQTFMLCGIDPRPAAAFPAVMVSVDMQGGCVCENADYLRIGINNIALASLFAPKPMAMSGADDWTIDIEKKGLPEMKQVWSLYGKADNVHAKAFPQFKHNYNQVAREMMYGWFNEHLKLGQTAPIVEKDFKPVPPKELSVWNDEHPVPKDVKNAAQLREYLTEVSKKQWEELKPTTPEKLKEFQRVVGTAARVMLDDGVPAAEGVESSLKTAEFGENIKVVKGPIGRKGAGEKVPFLAYVPKKFSGTILVGSSAPRGIADSIRDGKLVPQLQDFLDAGHAIALVDPLYTGEYVEKGKESARPKVQEGYGGFTFGYNRPALSQQVHDVLTGIAVAKTLPGVKRTVLIGRLDTLLARIVAGSQVDDAIISNDFEPLPEKVTVQDPNFLPGLLKYGGFYGLVAAAAPNKMMFLRPSEIPAAEMELLKTAYAPSKGNLGDGSKPAKELIFERLKQ
jgi:hypothetical protein